MTPIARQAKRVAWTVGVLVVLLIIDLVLVVMPAAGETPPFCTSVSTLPGGATRRASGLRGVAIHDGTDVKWVSGKEALTANWPKHWVQVALTPELPRTRSWGLLTPFCVSWDHRMELAIAASHGGAQAEAKLRREFALRVASDPIVGPRVPKWYISQLARSEGATSSFNYFLLGHDFLFVLATAVVVVGLIRLARIGIRYIRAIERGTCTSCGYDLTDATGEHCPECGTALAEARALESRGLW